MTTILLWLLAAYLGLMVLALAGMLGALAVAKVQLRRSKRRYARVVAARCRREGFLLAGFSPVEREVLRAAAAAQAAEAGFVTPGDADVDAFLARLFPRSKGAPKEGP